MGMTKTKMVFICQNCGAESPKWTGRCNSCQQWNTLMEETISSGKIMAAELSKNTNIPLPLEKIPVVQTHRIGTGIEEFDRVLGSGLVPGSLVLIGGEPGIGKSTLVLQLALTLHGRKILYASGEESLQQIKLRATRLKLSNPDCLFLCETSLEMILAHVEKEKPDILIIDSIQTVSAEGVESSPGSVTQVRECTSAILKYAKKNNTAVLLIGHINKEGNLAGPKVLEHIVDTVIQFEGDSHHMFRILRPSKNRFGSTSEIGIFEMRQDGLSEIKNPSEHLISKGNDSVSGTAIAATLEGVRPFMIEIQGLVSSAAFGMPQRSSTGFDLHRLNMLLAVLEKRAGFKLLTKDVFLNVAGGLRITDPAIDLTVLIAVLSSSLDMAVSHQTCFAGEVGLTGEIRPVSRIDQRVAEASRLGFSKIFIPRAYQRQDFSSFNIEITKVARIEDVFRNLFK